MFEKWLGVAQRADDVVTPRLITMWRSSLDYDGLDTSPLPLGLHWGLATPLPANSELSEDGHPRRGDFLPPIPLPRRMWAGGQLQILDGFRGGDKVIRKSVVQSVEQKSGRSGDLWFVAVSHEWSTPRGQAILERQDIVYREASGESAPTQSRQEGLPPKQGLPTPRRGPSLEVVCSELKLFRFSGLTFNAHRIHYDLPYATDEEGYPGLVVHGPLQATLLLNFARQICGGRSPSAFGFRGVSPLILGAPFRLNANETASGYDLWVSDAGGNKTMTAKAEWSA